MEPSRYALLEDEQRFVVPRVPDGATSPRRIDDRYLTGTRLRVRRVEDDGGVVYKLGQKVRPDPSRPSSVWHTTTYLDDAEYALLHALAGATLSKRRWTIDDACVDEFLGRLQGLVLVEGPRPLRAPPGGVEVTDDERFTGGALASTDEARAAEVLALARSLRS